MSLTLAQLEQETARRVGPYVSTYADRTVPTTATVNSVVCPALKSSIDQDLVTHLWLLRRTQTGDDRQRQVSSYDPETGRVTPDSNWTVPPVPGEVFEFHHLNPSDELRISVLAGLARCFTPDLVQVVPTGQWGQIDLTAQYAWLTDPWQVFRVQYGWVMPYQDAPHEAIRMGGHLVIQGMSGYWYYPTSVWVSAWRPASSWVNGAESTTGPVADADVLAIDTAYAAAAGHIEAWHLFPARMFAAAAGGYQATQQMAATEFSRQANMLGPNRNVSIGFTTLVGGGTSGSAWVNR